MALSLGVKRPAEDFLPAPFHHVTDSAMKSSPMQLLADIAAPRGAKRRKDDFPSCFRPVMTDYPAEEESDSSFTEQPPHEDDIHREPLSSEHKNKLDRTHHDEAQDDPNPQRGFPCVWLNGSSPSRHPEEEDRASEPQLSPAVTSPAPCVPRASTPPPPLEPLPVGTLIIQPTGTVDEHRPQYASPKSALPLTPDFLKHQSSPNGSLLSQGTPGLNMSELMARGNLGSDSDISSDMVGSPGGEGMEVCPECHKVFKRKVYLQRHMEREHWSTAKVFKCADCAYQTKHQSNLSVHRRTHTGERPYHCGCCGQRYTQGHLLKSHIRSRHAGNMEFYNLDKKSESTRGRKSLDIKHEAMLGLSNHKQDKISALLQAAAANGNNNGIHNSSLPPMGKYGAGLLNSQLNSQFMNSMSYFNPMRPMLGNPMSQLSGGLLGSPRLFNLPGLTPPNASGFTPSSLMSSLPPPSLSLLNSHSSLNLSMASTAATDSLKRTIEAMESKPKVNMMLSPYSSPSMGGLQIPVKLPELPPQPKTPTGPQLSPQDLTTKKGPAEADIPEHISSKQLLTSECPSEPQDLSHPRYAMVSGASPARPQESDSATIPSPTREDTQSPYMSRYHSEPESLVKPPSPSERYTATPTEEEVVKDLSPAPVHSHDNHDCHGDDCPHLKKLKDLRRNVFRMLSVFTPDLSHENGISSETEDVDELLYEVIYTNMEEETSSLKD